MNRRILIITTLVVLMSASSFLLMCDNEKVYAEDESYDDGPWTYVVENGNAVIVDWYFKHENNGIVDGVLEIPGIVKSENDTADRAVVEIRGKGIGNFNVSGLKEIILPESLKTITTGAFRGCPDLEKIDLTYVTTIGHGAFSDCVSLKTVIMPAFEFIISADNLGYTRIFSGCTSLEHTDLRNLREGSYVGEFPGCTSLKTVLFPDTYKIGTRAFQDCTSLESMNITNAVSIGSGAFKGCTSLNEITMPDTEYVLEWDVFLDCSSLERLDLKNITGLSIPTYLSTFIGSGLKEFTVANDSEYFDTIDGVLVNKARDTMIAFPPAKTLDYKVPDGIKTIGIGAFQASPIERVNLNDVTHVDDYAFAGQLNGCKSLKTVTSPNLTSVGKFAFLRCTALETIDLSMLTSAVSIQYPSFRECTSLTTVDVSSLDDIGDVFFGCTSLAAFTASSSTLYEALDGLLYSKDMKTLMRVPYAWDETHFVVPEGVESLGDRVFKNYVKLITVDISNVTNMGNETFMGCTSLTTVNVNQFIELGDGVFNGCTALETIDLSMITKIGDYTFNDCKSLQSVDMNVVTYIGDWAFGGCSSFTKIFAPICEYVGTASFRDCERLLMADVSKSLVIGGGAFLRCDKLVYADISSAEVIYTSAFSECKALTEVIMPEAEITIEISAFSNCQALETINLSNVTSIGHGAFNGCFRLQYVYAPLLVTADNNAFYGCTTLAYAYLPKLVEMENRIFQNCTNIQSIYAPQVILGSNAMGYNDWFKGCTNIRSLVLAEIGEAMNNTDINVRYLCLTSDYRDNLELGYVPSKTTICYYHDAEGWDSTAYKPFHYVSYESDGKEIFRDAVIGGGTAKTMVPLSEGEVWMLDGDEYNFAKPVTADIVLSKGTVVSDIGDNDGPDDDNAMRVLAAIASIVAIAVIAAIFIMRRPA